MQFYARLSLGAALSTLALAGLPACNSDGGQSLANDWVTRAAPIGVVPADPVASPTPSPSATTNPSDLYSGPAEVSKYVQKFVDDAKAQGVDVLPDLKNPTLTIQLATLSEYGSLVIGLCESGGSMRRVTFDPDFWNSQSETQRELLAHHELGHCVLSRAHRSDKLSTGLYASIMYPTLMSNSTYTNNYAYYQQELFTQAAQAPSDPTLKVTHICNLEDLGER